MKKALANTRVSVKLRKSEYREEWYLYVGFSSRQAHSSKGA